MLIEQPPFLYRVLFPEALWRIETGNEKSVYLTFDDGPIPEVTPWVLEILEQYGIKATFFCVGDNVRKHPDVYRQVIEKGHQVGNHTFNHLQGWQHDTKEFLHNIGLARQKIDSTLFRPPHGHMWRRQTRSIRAAGYQVVMWDVVTRDYSRHQSPEKVLSNVKKHVRDGSIIVFHDSLKAEENLRYALPEAIEWLLSEGYQFKLIPKSKSRSLEKRDIFSIRKLANIFQKWASIL